MVKPEEDWIYCMKCMRCYSLVEARWNLGPRNLVVRESLLRCAHTDCGASYLSRGLHWPKVRQLYPELDLPEVPVRSRVYYLEPDHLPPPRPIPPVQSQKYFTRSRPARFSSPVRRKRAASPPYPPQARKNIAPAVRQNEPGNPDSLCLRCRRILTSADGGYICAQCRVEQRRPSRYRR